MYTAVRDGGGLPCTIAKRQLDDEHPALLRDRNHAVSQINMRFSTLESHLISVEGRAGSIESRLNARMARIEDDLKAIVRLMGDMGRRIARLEERSTR